MAVSKKDMYLDYLRGEGYMPDVDDDGDIRFKKEGRTYYIEPYEDDPTYFNLWAANFWSIESKEEE